MLVLGFFVRFVDEIFLGFVIVMILEEVVGELVFEGFVVMFFCKMIGWGELIFDDLDFLLFGVMELLFWWSVGGLGIKLR